MQTCGKKIVVKRINNLSLCSFISDMDIEDAPAVTPGELAEAYFVRARDYWSEKAESLAKQEGMDTLSAKQLKKAAQKMATEYHQKNSS